MKQVRRILIGPCVIYYVLFSNIILTDNLTYAMF